MTTRETRSNSRNTAGAGGKSATRWRSAILPFLLLLLASCAAPPPFRPREHAREQPRSVLTEARMGASEIRSSKPRPELVRALEQVLDRLECSHSQSIRPGEIIRLEFVRPRIQGSITVGPHEEDGDLFRMRYTYRVRVNSFTTNPQETEEMNAVADLLSGFFLDWK